MLAAYIVVPEGSSLQAELDGVIANFLRAQLEQLP